MDTNLQPRFAGQFLFGDQANFAWNPLVGGPESVDEFLGNPAGTTIGPSQHMYGASGSFTATTSGAVQDALDLLASFSGPSFPLGLPTGLKFPVNYFFTKRWCYFLPQEFVPSAIGSAPGNMYQATYQIVLREVGLAC